MIERIAGQEPDPKGPRLRRFTKHRHIPYKNLAELRSAMVADDKKIIEFMGARVMEDYWQSAVEDPSLSARRRVGALAIATNPWYWGIPHLVEAVYDVLAPDTSPLIDAVDLGIVHAIAARTNKAMLATVFKADKGEGIAPAQQMLNRARAVQLAQDPLYAIHPDYGDFPALIGDVYDLLVPITANELQQAMFMETCWDDWDAGLAAAFKDVVVAEIIPNVGINLLE